MYAVLLSREGRWRAQFLWRFFGLVIYQYGLLLVAFVHGRELFESYGLHLAFPAAFLLIIFGSRLWVLATTAALMIACALPYLLRIVERQIGEELIIFTSLPVMGALLVVLAAVDQYRRAGGSGATQRNLEFPAFQRDVDAAHVALFRITAVLTMAFATVHKLNWDFFDPDASCTTVLASELASWWSVAVPDFVLHVSPLEVVIGEGLVTVLLLTYPRLGILACAVVVGVIGHRGATAFSMLTFALSSAFLYERDGETLLAGLRRHWPWVLAAALAMAPVSAKYFVPLRPWYEFLVFQLVILLVILAASYLMAVDWLGVLHAGQDARRRALSALLVPRRRVDGFAQAGKSAKIALAAFALLGLVNGLSPYLGLKYRLSFAMLSNLRVDDNRWNSFIFPRWLYLRRHDPFVHVTFVMMDARGEQLMEALERKSTRGLYVGLFSPMSFKYRMKFVEFNAKTLDLDAVYEGRAYSFRDALQSAEFKRWVAALPDGKMFHEGLVAEGPQPCVH